MRSRVVLTAALALLTSVSVASAWTGPSSSPPNSNVSAPVNVGGASQVKNGALGVNALTVFGNTLLGGASGSNAYLNFGPTSGSSGYGVRDNGGTIEFKNAGGGWSSLQSVIYTYCQGGSCGGTSQWTTNGSSIYYNGGNVGVGTSAPGYKLDVNGDVRASGVLLSSNAPGYSQTQMNTWGLSSPGTMYLENGPGSNLYLTDQWSATGALVIRYGAMYFQNSGGANTASISAAGTASFPTVCLNGDCRSSWPAAASGTVTGSGSSGYIPRWTGASSLGNAALTSDGSSATATGNFFINGYLYDGSNTGYYLKPAATSNLNSLYTQYASTPRIDASIMYDRDNTGYYVDPSSVSILNDARANIFYDSGNTGYYLQPRGTSNLNLVYVNDLRPSIIYDKDNTGYYLDPNSVSILNDVRANIFYDSGNTGYYLQPRGTSNLNALYTQYASTPRIDASIMYDRDNTSYYVDPSSTSNFNTVAANNYYAQGSAGVNLSTGGCTSYDTYYTQGLLTAYGNEQYLCGVDIAEPYPTDGALAVERGYIVAPSSTTASYDLTVTNPAAGESTTTPYRMTVAKMHVAQPGEREEIYGAVPTRAFDLNRGMKDSGTQLVSLAGHVPVHVTLEHGPIAVGDPITLSDTKAGYGTKATTPGKILGYALAPYTGGDGMIEVSMKVQEWQPAGEVCATDSTGSTCITKAQLDALLSKLSS